MKGNRYRISTTKAKEFIKKYNSYYTVKNYNTVLGVISFSVFDNITKKAEDESLTMEKQNIVPPPIQTKLL